MSYIISKNNPFVNTKLTEKGRMKLAKGQLNFKFWSVGDSEINYGFEEIRDANPGDAILQGKSLLFKPKDNQANIKYFISKSADISPMNSLLDSDVKVIKALINNRAPERGFFNGTEPRIETPYVPFHTQSSDGQLVPNSDTIGTSNFDGGNTITLPSYVSVGNLILFRLGNGSRHWYKVESKAGDVCTLDRALPLLSDSSASGTPEVASLQITGPATTAGDVTVTLGGVPTVVTVALDDTPIMVADKIRATSFTGWTTGGTVGTDTVTFTANTVGAKTDAVYSEGTTGATGVMTTTTQGVNSTDTGVEFIEYASGNVYENDMANSEVTPYWDVNTLTFDNTSNVTTEEVPVWNMNNIWAENIIGLNTDTAEEFYKYGSNDMIGTRSPFLCYIDTIAPSDIQLEDVCFDASTTADGSTLDSDNRAISVIHYTNNEISNLYGEFFYVDATGKGVEVVIPDMMYHRRKGGTSNGNTLGMTFKTDGSQIHTIKNSSIEYYDLIEDPDLVDGDAKVVGKVLPYYHTIIFDNEEIVAAVSYKSGRNWTLPELKLTLSNPTEGSTTGLLAQGETIYVTYVLEDSGNGLPYSLPCQRYAKITNNNTTTKDVSYIINSIDELPYMKKTVNDGEIGFSAKTFKVLYQIVQGNERPKSNAWKEYAIESSETLNGAVGETLIPSQLEAQLPEQNGFRLTKTISDASTIYVINDKLNLPDNVAPDNLQFGDERFFYGNIRADIGATIYKTVFDIKIGANEFNYTTNPTRAIDDSMGVPEIRVSEVGIYDNEKNLVFMGKLSEPIKLINGNTLTVELSMDF